MLSRDPVAALLETNVTPMQADWTRPDPKIANYLASFGRYGIPFNVVYGPRCTEWRAAARITERRRRSARN